MGDVGARFGRSRVMDTRLLLCGIPGAGEVAQMMVGHFVRQIGDHLNPADAQVASDLLGKVAVACVETCEEAWEQAHEGKRRLQGRVRRRGTRPT